MNHLGRNLYRNVITVLGEAISNSWDADAKNVYITIDRENNYMSIQDDGMGMTDDDFQGKFLKIGYSKRKKGDYTSPSGRPFIGRKGIGKLLISNIINEVKEMKMIGMKITADSCNIKAVNLYKSFGFKKEGEYQFPYAYLEIYGLYF